MEAMESWRRVWRGGLAPLLSVEDLHCLQTALEADDPRLVQGMICCPAPGLYAARCGLVESACLLSYPGWQVDGLETVEEVEELFARMCFAIDVQAGESAASHWLISWFDSTDRAIVRRELLAEINLALSTRQEVS